jgi:dephospho-CoA kinase
MRVAVTGGIGEGKSSILAALERAGHPVASSDAIARELFEEPSVQEALAAVLSIRGSVSRERLRGAIAGSSSCRRRVNRVFFPRILTRLDEVGPAFVEVPLLVETCLQNSFSRVWVAHCGHEEQRARLMQRYRDETLVHQLIHAQLPTEVKMAFADLIVRTNEPVEAVNDFVIRAAEREIASHIASS